MRGSNLVLSLLFHGKEKLIEIFMIEQIIWWYLRLLRDISFIQRGRCAHTIISARKAIFSYEHVVVQRTKKACRSFQEYKTISVYYISCMTSGSIWKAKSTIHFVPGHILWPTWRCHACALLKSSHTCQLTGLKYKATNIWPSTGLWTILYALNTLQAYYWRQDLTADVCFL